MTATHHKLAIIALLATAVLMLLLCCSFWVNALPQGSLIMGVIIVLYEITLPIEILKYFHLRARDYNIYAHNIDTIIDNLFPPYGVKKLQPDIVGMYQELLSLCTISLIILIPYIAGYWAYAHVQAIRSSSELVISLNLPPRLWYEIIMQIFVVALPEELFYRGFLQSALLKIWPNRTRFLGLPLGRAILLTNIFFALGHLLTTWSPARLLTFFPGLIFSYLVFKNKSILAVIIFHALCNIVGQILYASFYIK